MKSALNEFVLRELQIAEIRPSQSEKLFHLVAGVIPGFTALLIFHLATPGSFGWFFTMGFLGYKSKLSLVLFAAFLIGNSVTTFLSSLLGAIGASVGGLLGLRPYKPSHSYDVAPWRDPRWRTLLKNHLGAQAPNDTQLVPKEVFDLRCKMVEYLPEQERPRALLDLDLEKSNAETDDGKWAQWYDYYHQTVLQSDDRDIDVHVRKGLIFNLQTASLYVLISAIVVPGVRHWWCILPSCIWVLTLVGEGFSTYKRFTDKWSTLFEQMKYLSGDAGRA